MEKTIPNLFEAFFEDDFTPTNDPDLRIANLRVFYTGLNRNGSFITDEFAAALAPTAYMKPVIGNYDHMAEDFGGHEGGPEKKKAYGFVLPNSLTWTDHLDKDGVTRSYATYKVLIWAKYWDEAIKVLTSAESMEIYRDSIQGEWKVIDNVGTEAFKYTAGTIAGLCVLGKTREPCFEGAEFFSAKDEEYAKFMKAIQRYCGGNVLAMDEENKVTAAAEMENNDEAAPAAEEPASEMEETSTPAAEETHEEPAAEAEAKKDEVEDENEETEDNEKKKNGGCAACEAEESDAAAEETHDYAAELASMTEEYNALKEKYEALSSDYEALAAEKVQISSDFTSYKEKNEEIFSSLKKDFEKNQEALDSYILAEKNQIIEKFSKCLPVDAVSAISEQRDTLTVDELNTKFALEYTKYSMEKGQEESVRIPHIEKPVSHSALYNHLQNYKK